MDTPEKTAAELLFDRDIEMWFAAAEVMSVIRNGNVHEVWRENLLSAHFQMVYHYAHSENERIDYAIKSKSWRTGDLADRIVVSITGKARA